MYTIFVRYALENLTGKQLERKENDDETMMIYMTDMTKERETFGAD